MSHYHSPYSADGPDLILQAGQTRIHVKKAVLTENSPVFRAMFSRAEEAGADLTNGLPVVRIDDSPEDMYLVLDALCDPAFYMETTKSFKIVSAMLRLGKKYGIDELYEDAISRLEHDFPSTLLEYQELHGQTRSSFSVKLHIAPYPALGFEVVNLARAYGLNQILPAALYICVTVHFNIHDVKKAIQDGLVRDDGRVVHLSEEDKDRCWNAIDKLIEAQRTTSFRYFYDMPEDIISRYCSERSNCTSVVAYFRRLTSYPPLCVIALRGMEILDQALCDECADHAVSVNRMGQTYIWQHLPSFFGLPPWADLHNS
ncbi:hypothetical protein DFH09DRAFT_1390775 [Mycena vulgaris]|nr:hypothetical protein DFH09DRAFT_1390775 [Mycena vulgaris]